MKYLKQAPQNPQDYNAEAQQRVAELLGLLEREGEAAARRLSLELDRWEGPHFTQPRADCSC